MSKKDEVFSVCRGDKKAVKGEAAMHDLLAEDVDKTAGAGREKDNYLSNDAFARLYAT